ncbi:MAG: hypothetical protein Q9169_006143 [Polycauliona sp. 2 TL-2023]
MADPKPKAPPPPSQWLVDYYQLNASVDHKGDAAVVVLVEKDKDATKPGTVRSLVLLDGGNGLETAALVVTTLGRIKAKYNVVNDPQFDAIVISHWDYDHCKGALGFLVLDTNWNLGTKKHKYLKYDDKGVGTTRLYCQAFRAGYTNKPYIKGRLKPSTGFTQQVDPFNASLPPRVADKREITDIKWVDNVLRVYHNLNVDLRGCNIFSGNFSSDIDNATSPLELVKSNDPWTQTKTNDWQNAPGLYIVGATSKYLQPPPKGKAARSGGRLRIVNETLKPFDINQDSIICMLIWKDQTNPLTVKPKLSLFSGGDAEWAMEDNVGSWIDSEVEVLKTGHHGSLAGTSTKFVETIAPKHVLLSAGDDHNHPGQYLLDIPLPRKSDSVCYPYNLGYVMDPAYFKGVRFFVSKHSFTSRFKALPSDPPSGHDARLFYDFFKWLETTDPDHIGEIRKRILDAQEWFDADVAKAESYQAVVQAQKTKFDQAEAAWVADGSKKKGPLMETHKEEKKIYDEMSDTAKYQNYFNVNFISWVVANCWDALSDVDNEWYPAGVDTDGITEAGSKMEYQHVQFFADADPTFEIVPKPKQKSNSGRRPLIVVKKKKKDSDDGKAVRHPGLLNGNEVQLQNTAVANTPIPARGKKRGPGTPMEPITFTRARYVMSLNQEAGIKRLEYSPDVPDVEMNDVDYDGEVTPPAKRNVARAMSGGSSLTQFESIVSSIDAVQGSAILLQDSQDQQNAYNFLRALPGASLTLSSPTSTSSTWSAVLNDDDPTYEWLWAYLAVNDAASNITMLSSGVTDTDPDSGFKVALLTDTTLSFFLGESTTSMTFKSSAVSEGFNIDLPAGTVDSYGFTENGAGLMLGLSAQASSDNTFTLTNFLQLVGIEDSLLDGSTQLKLCKGKQGIANLPDPINGVWYYPQNNSKTVITMCAQAETPPNNNRLIGLSLDIPGCNFSNSTIMVTKSGYLTSTYVADSGSSIPEPYVCSTGSFCIQSQLSLGNPASMTCQCWIDVNEDSLSLTLQWDKTQSPTINSFLTWVANLAGIQHGNAWSDFEDICGNVLGALHLRQAALDVSKVDGAWKFAADFSMTFEVDCGSSWGLSDDNPLPIMLTFEYKSSDPSGNGSSYAGIRGGMWTRITDEIVAMDRLDSNAPFAPRLTPIPDAPSYAIDLLTLGGMDKASYTQITGLFPTLITSLSFELSNQSVGFSGTMMTDPATEFSQPNGTVPFLRFDEVTIKASYTYPSASSGKHLDFYFETLIVLTPRGPDPPYSAGLEVSILYDNGAWTFEGLVTDLDVGSLYSLFPSADSDAIMNVMEEITIQDFHVVYNYSGPTTSTIVADGTLQLGPVTLEIDYAFNGKDAWTFSASLGVEFTSGNIILGEFLSGVCADVASILPDFVYNTQFLMGDQTGRAEDATPPIRLLCEKVNDFFVLSIMVEARGFDFAYIQLTDSARNQGVKPPKRMLRFEMESLPAVDSVPLLKTLGQPFDQLDLIWTSDDFTKGEVEFLNTDIFTTPNERLTCKPAVTPNADPAKQNDDIVLLKGVHFMVIAEQDNVPTAVLDYVFGGTPTGSNGSTTTSGLESFNSDPIPKDDSPPISTPTGAATAPWTKTIGPLTIAAIGLKYLDRKLQLTLDATLKINGVEVQFKGFGLRFPMQSASSFERDITQVELLLDGMGLSLSRPPLMIAGTLQRIPTGYAGGITVSFEPYTFLAMGAYMNITQTTILANGQTAMDTFKSILVLLEVVGPIAELEFASLDGLTGGYGYNSQMRLPSIDEVTSHPFLASSQIAAPSPTGDMLTTMGSLTGGSNPWFTPKDGPMWVAGGLTAGLFQILDVDVVLAVDISDDVTIAVFGDCQAAIPSAAKNDSERFAFVELGFEMVLDYAKGSFQCQGKLNPKSYILSQNCHLSGGFALCYWFEGSGHEGDWVFSVGGYHSQYVPPTWYPRVPRLAIDWKYDDNLSIHGEAYFAITPKVCMGGGKLNLLYQSGSIDAHLDAWADFLINYKPFAFTAGIGVTVGASYTFRHFGIVKTVGGSIGCSLELHGPPVAGKVKVDWKIISFSIAFGPAPPKLSLPNWQDFTALLLQNPASAAKRSGIDPLHALAATAGVIPAGSHKTTPSTWTVDGSAFAFRFTSLFPIRALYDSSNTKIYTSDKAAPFMKPMHITSSTDMTSNLTISITDEANQDVTDFFTISPISKKVPAALWGPYDPRKDPSIDPKQPSLLTTTDATIDQITGFDIGPCTTTSSNDVIQLDIANHNSIDVFAATPSAAPILPSALSIPLTLPSLTNPLQKAPLNSSQDPTQTQYTSCIRNRASWVPDFSSDTLPQAEKVSALSATINNPLNIQSSSIVASWIAFKGLDPTTEGSGMRYASLGTDVGVICAPFDEDVALPPPRLAVAATA